jgi:hypothetical protein
VAVGFEWVPPDKVSTQFLLSRIDTEIRREPSQYTWENNAILFSDEEAKRRSFTRINSILRWRKLYRSDFEIPPGFPLLSTNSTVERTSKLDLNSRIKRT